MEYQTDANCEYRWISHGRQTAGANVRRQEENNPDRRLRSQRHVKWETMWEGTDSQDVGLEAAIIKRKRNSSLVESACAEDVTGLNMSPKPRAPGNRRGRGAFRKPEKPVREHGWRQRKCEC